MPVIFFGHGNPMNALSKNVYTDAWAAFGESIARPKAVLAISAHWYIPYCAVTANLFPPTIHDFGGFPQELYELDYPASGCPELATRVRELLAPVMVKLDENWGLDHGTWSVLLHVIPNADIPVVQLSLDRTQPPEFHYEMGKRLKPLREEGILIICSGNIVHNLTAFTWDNGNIPPFTWALRFEQQIQSALVEGDDSSVVDYHRFGYDAALSVPTPEHYLPLLYTLGLRHKKETVSFPVQGVDGGSISMLSIRMG